MYKVKINGIVFPIAPSKITVKSKNKNKTVDLLSGGEIDIIKKRGLNDFSFDLILPNSKGYPFAIYEDGFHNADYYIDILKKLKKNKLPFQLYIHRGWYGTKYKPINVKVTLEDFSYVEDADKGNDVTVGLSFKEYKTYATKVVSKDGKVTKDVREDHKKQEENLESDKRYHIVKYGECLWSIAKYYYGSGAAYIEIYNANKDAIEEDAKKHGKKSSSNGNYLWPGLKLLIPNVDLSKYPKITGSSSGSSSSGSAKNCTVSIHNSGVKSYYGTFDVYVDGKLRRGGTASEYSISVPKGSSVKITCKGKDNHAYMISPTPSFKVYADKKITISWVM